MKIFKKMKMEFRSNRKEFWNKAGYRRFARRQWDARISREKKGTRDNVKINYIRFLIRLLSRTIILSFIAWENPFVSCIITASTARRFKMRDTRNLSHELRKKYKITCTRVLHLTCFLHLTNVSWIIYSCPNYEGVSK